MRKNEIQINDVLQETFQSKESLYNGTRFNKTSKFCLPMVDLHCSGKALSRYLVNAYLDDLGLEHDIEQSLFLLFSVRSQKDKMWRDFCDIFSARGSHRKFYVTDYYVGKKGNSDLIMYVLQIPNKWQSDFELFKKGRYSLFSKEYRSLFPKTVQLNTGEKVEGKEWGIINKSAFRKDFLAKEFINPPTTTVEQAMRFRKEMDNWDEIWEIPLDDHEKYHYTDANTNTAEIDSGVFSRSGADGKT